MKHILSICTLSLLLVSTALAQEQGRDQAWEIIFKTHVEPLTGAPQHAHAVNKVRKLNKRVTLEESDYFPQDSDKIIEANSRDKSS